MARSSLFFRPRWLGTFERATKSKCAHNRSVAEQSNCALPAREYPRLAAVVAGKFRDGVFSCQSSRDRCTTKRWGTLLHRVDWQLKTPSRNLPATTAARL